MIFWFWFFSWIIFPQAPEKNTMCSAQPMTFWGGSGSGSADPCLWLMDPDPDPGSRSCYFRHWPSRCQQKTNFLTQFFLLITFWSYIYIIFQRWMRSSLVFRASDCQCTSCNGPGFDPSIRRHSGIWGAADKAVLNIVRKKKKKSPQKIYKKKKKISEIKSLKESQNSRNQVFSYYFCMMIEGSGSRAGSGSIPLTSGFGSGSGRPKNVWIRWIRIRIRIRIRNTDENFSD